MIRWLAVAFLALLAAVIEVAAVPFLPSWLAVRPLVAFLVLCVIGSPKPRGVVAAVLGGLVVDAFSYARFDAATFRLVLLVFLIDLVARHWLTNRSLYAALAMAVLARCADWVMGWLVAESAYALTAVAYPPVFWRDPLQTLAWDVALVGVGFLALALFSGRFSLTAIPKDPASRL
jgi:cell shape-determining protein MreD